MACLVLFLTNLRVILLRIDATGMRSRFGGTGRQLGLVCVM